MNKTNKKRNVKETIKLIIGLPLMIAGFLAVITGGVLQQIEIYRQTGLFLADAFITHWSLWLYFGVVPIGVGYLFILF